MTTLRMLNIGCGASYNPNWVNIDFTPHSRDVLACDITKGLNYPDNYFDACYTSHLLEHLTQLQAKCLLSDIYRVLKPGGVCRVVVPDFRRIAEDYLSVLDRIDKGDSTADEDYDWIMLQFLDQSVRKTPGGEMAKYWRKTSRSNDKFVIARAGAEAANVIAMARSATPPSRRSIWEKAFSRSISWYLTNAREQLAKFFVLSLAGRRAKQCFSEGLFRNSGEIHNWAYDAYSLTRALAAEGFVNAHTTTAFESQIQDFLKFSLDTVGNDVRKPDSLFMEALKPL